MGVPVLHCYADHKWTGASEPVVQLCHELSRRGWRSDLVCRAGSSPDGEVLAARARNAGLTVHEGFALQPDARLWRAVKDAMRLRRLILAGEYGIVHCHGTWDHIVAYWALKGRRASVPLVRTDHGARDYRRGMFRVFFYGPRMTDHLIVLSDRYVVQAVNRMGRDPQSTTAVRGAVDTDLYRPMDAPAGLRERLALAPGDVVFGLVARIQRHRRFDVLLEAAAIAHGRDPRVRVVVLGRGTLRKQILDIPAARMGLQGVVLPLGYRTDDYREVLSALDAGLMLAPGSDGSCRAALQIASMGKPLIVVERGTLPDIVRDGETGIVTHCTPEALAEAMLEVASDAGRRQQSGRAGRERMRRLFTLSRQTDRVEDVYRRLLAARRAGSAL